MAAKKLIPVLAALFFSYSVDAAAPKRERLEQILRNFSNKSYYLKTLRFLPLAHLSSDTELSKDVGSLHTEIKGPFYKAEFETKIDLNSGLPLRYSTKETSLKGTEVYSVLFYHPAKKAKITERGKSRVATITEKTYDPLSAIINFLENDFSKAKNCLLDVLVNGKVQKINAVVLGKEKIETARAPIDTYRCSSPDLFAKIDYWGLKLNDAAAYSTIKSGCNYFFYGYVNINIFRIFPTQIDVRDKEYLTKNKAQNTEN